MISSATVLMNGYHIESAIERAKQLRCPLGIHINLTEGPLVDQSEIFNNTLVKQELYVPDESGEAQ